MSDRIRFGAVALDCADPRTLGDFYARLTGWSVAFSSDRFVAVGEPGTVYLTMHQVAEHRPPTWPEVEVPKQIHLDFAVDDLAATERRALDAGAARAARQPAPDRFLVMLDPAGHPFCLSTQFPDS